MLAVIKKLAFIFILLVLLPCQVHAWTKGQISFWARNGLTGGGNALDGIAGVSIGPSDMAISSVTPAGTVYFHGVALDSAAESSPTTITPDDVGGGATRWRVKYAFDSLGPSQVSAYITALLAASSFTGATDFAIDSQVSAYVQSQVSQYTTTLSNPTFMNLGANAVYAGASTWFVYSGVTLTGDMLAGGLLYVHTPATGVTPTRLGIPAIGSSTPYFLVKDMTGHGVTVQTTGGDSLYGSSGAAGTAYFLNAGYSRNSATFKVNCESGACKYVDVIGEVGSNWHVK